MSAGSPRRSRSQIRSTLGSVTVSPQHVTDPSILDSVAGFINEVATYNAPFDAKDQIQWARFEHLDCDAVLENLGDKIIPSSLILVLGYSTGVQVWAVPASGEAVELLSWRHGSVRVLRFLPTPYVAGRSSQSDDFASKRPLVALCDTTTPGPHHCALSFLSLKTGEQVKVIKFKNPLLDVLANRRSVVVTFSERIAVFDAFTLEDRLTVTTCYLSPGVCPNPVALGARWMAYAEKKLITSKRSNGGNEGEAVQSYTATVLHAAKSLSKGLRELSETVASSLTGNSSFKPGTSPGNSQTMSSSSDALQKGVVTILDIESQAMDDRTFQTDGLVAHFAAHTEAIVCLAFDPSGLLLLTADKRGHDFYLFRIHPHPEGSSLAAVHHLYILHRGDTTAKVQDMCFSPDSRWVAVSTLRGTTHVFPITPYGGNVGVRTHATPHVVNRMSRFHRSAGLPVEGRSNSPVTADSPKNSNLPYNNPRLPPYPHPTVVHPLAQIRQPLFVQVGGNMQQRPLTAFTARPRLNSSSEDTIQVALRLCCCFASARAWFDNVTPAHEMPITKQQARPVESLFIMSCHGTLVQYDLDPHHIMSVPKEKVCDETPIELTVQAKAQWILQRQPHSSDAPLPMSPQNIKLLPQDAPLQRVHKPSHTDDRWLSQVEIVTHAGPHRRLWMGPQFTFKTYTTTNGSPVSLTDAQTVDVGRSKPVNMPVSTTYPILIESSSVSSCEQSPKLLDTYQRLSEEAGGAGELQLKEDLADAMLESPGVRESGGRCVIVSMKPYTTCVAKVVNPLGTVVTIHSDEDVETEAPEDAIIHENCDEALFRPVVGPKPLLFAETRPRSVNKSTQKSHPVDGIHTTENEKIIKLESGDPVEIDQAKAKKGSSKYQSKSTVKINMSIPKFENEDAPKVKAPKAIGRNQKTSDSSSKPVETKMRITKPLTKIADMAPQIIEIASKPSDIPEGCVTIVEPITTTITLKKPKLKMKNIIPSDGDGEKQKSSSSKTDRRGDFPVLKPIVTTPDLMDSVDTLDFPFSSKSRKKREQADDATPFPKCEDALKEDKFEDARDTSEMLESFSGLKLEKDTPSYKYQGLEPDEIVFSSEEEKSTVKKPRKPKAKLGVRLSKNKDSAEKEGDCSVEVTLPAPAKSWSSVVSAQKFPDRDAADETKGPILDLTGIESTPELPKKSYSTAAKQHLLEIDPHEDLCHSGILLPEKVYKPSLIDTKPLKSEIKSDDGGSSQAETTESDDSSKVVAMDTEEDSCQPEVAKSAEPGIEKTVKRKSKKKKR